MRILGVDPALKITGYGIIDITGGKLALVKAGAIITSPKDETPKRLEKIYQGMRGLIMDKKPQIMILEKIFVHYHHPTTAFLLGQARGIICLACQEGNIPLVEYSATRVKKAIVGKGLASKMQVQKMVLNTLNINSEPKYIDVTDALALAIAYSNIVKSKI